MSAKYILRFDDFCPTMNWLVWDQIEAILAKHDIKPIIAVVPDNRDPKLEVAPPREDFWAKIRAWQAAGWTIALHGFQHVYSTPYAGLMKINNRSEFAGLTYTEQRHKLEQALAIFTENKVQADAWIAPAHAFDATTVRVLLDLNINIISDGFYLRPVKRLGAVWVPQQLWKFKAMPFGLWSICFHHNHFSEKDLRALERNIVKYAPSIIAFGQAPQLFPAKEANYLDRATEHFWHAYLRSKEAVAKHVKKLIK